MTKRDQRSTSKIQLPLAHKHPEGKKPRSWLSLSGNWTPQLHECSKIGGLKGDFLSGAKQSICCETVEDVWLCNLSNGTLPWRFEALKFAMELFNFAFQGLVRVVKIAIGLGKIAMFGLKLFELLLKMLNMLFLPFAESALGCAVLGSAALREKNVRILYDQRAHLGEMNLLCAYSTQILYPEQY